jgi:hypothetical protein
MGKKRLISDGFYNLVADGELGGAFFPALNQVWIIPSATTYEEEDYFENHELLHAQIQNWKPSRWLPFYQTLTERQEIPGPAMFSDIEESMILARLLPATGPVTFPDDNDLGQIRHFYLRQELIKVAQQFGKLCINSKVSKSEATMRAIEGLSSFLYQVVPGPGKRFEDILEEIITFKPDPWEKGIDLYCNLANYYELKQKYEPYLMNTFTVLKGFTEHEIHFYLLGLLEEALRANPSTRLLRFTATLPNILMMMDGQFLQFTPIIHIDDSEQNLCASVDIKRPKFNSPPKYSKMKILLSGNKTSIPCQWMQFVFQSSDFFRKVIPDGFFCLKEHFPKYLRLFGEYVERMTNYKGDCLDCRRIAHRAARLMALCQEQKNNYLEVIQEAIENYESWLLTECINLVGPMLGYPKDIQMIKHYDRL